MNFKLAIIEDEPLVQETITNIVQLVDEITIVGYATTINEAVNLIKKEKPQIAFLDVQLKDGLIFEALKELDEIDFKIIFITSHEEYAVKAFRLSAIDYIMKPIRSTDLITALHKAKNEITSVELQKINFLLQNFNSKQELPKRLLINSQSDLIAIDIKDIIRCEASNKYCIIYLNNSEEIVATKTLKEVSKLLTGHTNFIRVHRSHLLNINYFEKLDKSLGDVICLKNGHQVPLANSHKEDFIISLSQ